MSRRNAAAIREIVSLEDGVATCAEESEHPEQWDGLVAAWPMLEGGGATAFDFSGAGNIGTLTGGPTWTQGSAGNAIRFSGGVGKYITCGTSNELNLTSDLTLSAWITPASFGEGSSGRIFERRQDSPVAAGFMFCLFNASPANTLLFAAIGGTSVLGTANIITLNARQHVAVVRRGTTVTFYVNGIASGGGTVSAITPTTASTAALIGNASFFNRQFDGEIQDLRVRAVAVSQKQLIEEHSLGPNAWLTPRRRRSAFAVTSTPTTSRLLTLRRRSAA